MSTETVIFTPGETVGDLSSYTSGNGTYILNNNIISSIVGYIHLTNTESDKPTLNINRISQQPTLVPNIGDIILGRVTRVNPRFASVTILCIDETPLPLPFSAIIRKREVRQTQIDTIDMYQCFRAGDIVRGQVISLGDKKFYYISTAKNEYGVIFAQSYTGVAMVPISWDQFQCPDTKVIEYRKVARIE